MTAIWSCFEKTNRPCHPTLERPTFCAQFPGLWKIAANVVICFYPRLMYIQKKKSVANCLAAQKPNRSALFGLSILVFHTNSSKNTISIWNWWFKNGYLTYFLGLRFKRKLIRCQMFQVIFAETKRCCLLFAAVSWSKPMPAQRDGQLVLKYRSKTAVSCFLVFNKVSPITHVLPV